MWIEWRGSFPLARGWCNGTACELSAVDPDGIRSGETRLWFGPERVLRQASLEQGTLAGAGCGRRLLPRRLRQIHETRCVCRGRLNTPAGPADEGWVVHERIVLP